MLATLPKVTNNRNRTVQRYGTAMTDFAAAKAGRPRVELVGRPPRPREPLWENIPDDLKARPQWVLWRYEDRKGGWTKVPHQPNGRPASSTDEATWAPFDFVQTAYLTSGSYDGVGFVLTLGDPYVAFDFDHCVDRETGEITDPKVSDYVTQLNSYTEISPSGTGLRLIVRAKLPERDRRNGSFECYQDRRFVSITGHLYQGIASGHHR
jgi:putative DNA primase/helicase